MDKQDNIKDFKVSSATIDFSTAYAATEFIENTKPKEPWAKESFKILIDTLTNHSIVIYPHTTNKGLKNDNNIKNLPNILAALRSNNLILPHTNEVAEDILIDQDTFNETLNVFTIFATNNVQSLKHWINFHLSSKIKAKHIALMDHKNFTQKQMIALWKNNIGADRLSKISGIDSDNLMMAFDAFYRGIQYYKISTSADSLYFPHPLRKYIYSNDFEFERNYFNRWSWGSVLSYLIEDNKISRNQDELTDIISEIKNKMINLNATWYNNEYDDNKYVKITKDKIETIAIELGLPAKIKTNTLEIIQTLLGGTGALIDTIAGTVCLATITLSIGFQKIKENDIYISGKIGKLKFLRGSLSWPNLFI